MRIGRLAGIGWLAIVTAAGADGQEREIAVHIENPNAIAVAVLTQAEATATQVYAAIGVKLNWSNVNGTAIRMELQSGLPPQDYPGALGYALPYRKTGTRIHILVDRVLSAGSDRLGAVVLGHVMAHELGHVIEGFSHHADSGVMKAHWDRNDRAEMLLHPLFFGSEDARWIHQGLDRTAVPGFGPTASERPHKRSN